MGVLQKSFRVATRGHSDVLDITPQVARIATRKLFRMGVLQKSFRVATRGHSDVLDITPQVARIVAESGVQQGIVNVAGVGSTRGITTLELEPGCVADLRRALDQIAPADGDYAH